MKNLEQRIPCPVCNTTIPFDVNQLLMGVQFGCPNCHAAVGLATESKSLVKTTMEKIEELKAAGSPRIR